jgi:hypothetical protein
VPLAERLSEKYARKTGVGRLKACPTLTGAQQPAPTGQRLDAVFPADRHSQARRDALHSDAPCMPPAQVHDQRDIREPKQRQYKYVCVHVWISSRTRCLYQGYW